MMRRGDVCAIDLVNEGESVPRDELVDFTTVFILALERPYFAVCYLDMSGGWLERVLADLAQDRFAERRRLAEENGLEVKVLVIRRTILDALTPDEADRLPTFRPLSWRGQYGQDSHTRPTIGIRRHSF